MDRYTKTGLRLNWVTPRSRPGASRSVPTSPAEEALLFNAETPAPPAPDVVRSQEPAEIKRTVNVMYGVIHMDGSGEDNPPVEKLSDLYEELFSSGIMDGDVSVVNDTFGWGMSAHRDGRLVFEHLGGEGAPKHMIPVPKKQVLEL
jgi:hypothetical protein